MQPRTGTFRGNQVALRTQHPGLPRCLCVHGKPWKCSRFKLRPSLWSTGSKSFRLEKNSEIIKPNLWWPICQLSALSCPRQHLIGIRAITKSEKELFLLLTCTYIHLISPKKAVFRQDKSAEEESGTNTATCLRNKSHPTLNEAKIGEVNDIKLTNCTWTGRERV